MVRKIKVLNIFKWVLMRRVDSDFLFQFAEDLKAQNAKLQQQLEQKDLEMQQLKISNGMLRSTLFRDK